MNWELDRLPEAMAAFELTVRQYPSFIPAYRDIEYVAMDHDGRMLPMGIEMLEKMDEYNKHGALFHALGNLYFYDGQKDKAVMMWHEAKDRYREAMDSGDMNPWNSLGLATVLYYVGEGDDQIGGLLADAERLGFKEKNVRLLEELAWLYAEMEDCDSANRIFSDMKNKFGDYTVPLELRDLCP